MTFEEQIIATLIGTSSGVLLGIVAFILTGWLRALRKKQIIAKYLKKESEYNIAIITEWIKKLNSLKELIENTGHLLGSTKYFLSENFQNYFINASFENGLIYNKLDIEELNKLTSVMDDLSDWDNNKYRPRVDELYKLYKGNKTHKYNKKEINGLIINIIQTQIANFENYKLILSKLISKL